ncbi:hypothetical protein HBB16_19675 [Pseudonocardia sp. MCCB 268]|nr:hypothetical protein [Pseudonocardia cytotoxica]
MLIGGSGWTPAPATGSTQSTLHRHDLGLPCLGGPTTWTGPSGRPGPPRRTLGRADGDGRGRSSGGWELPGPARRRKLGAVRPPTTASCCARWSRAGPVAADWCDYWRARRQDRRHHPAGRKPSIFATTSRSRWGVVGAIAPWVQPLLITTLAGPGAGSRLHLRGQAQRAPGVDTGVRAAGH